MPPLLCAGAGSGFDGDGVDQRFLAFAPDRDGQAYPLPKTDIATAPPQIGQRDAAVRQIEAGIPYLRDVFLNVMKTQQSQQSEWWRVPAGLPCTACGAARRPALAFRLVGSDG